MEKFILHSEYKPSGDQPQAINSLVSGLKDGLNTQVLLGVTGSGKTFTMANVIAEMNRPALVVAHNKTLAAQLCNEFREFFPENRVEFFVSYYDYYQPEAYIPSTATYIEKEMSINDEIDKLRHSATCSLLERRDTIVVASVSCIYGLGAPKEYLSSSISLRPGDVIKRDDLIKKLVDIQYKRSDIEFERTMFRVRGDIIDIFLANFTDTAIRVEFFDDEIENISEIEALTGKRINFLKHIEIFPATHYVTDKDTLQIAVKNIRADLAIRLDELKSMGKLIEADRLNSRVLYDTEMMLEMGFCSGIENYSRYFDGRNPGEAPYTLFDYFPDDYILFIDESHMTLPQIRGMYFGDRSRKKNLVDYGFRLPSAYDNRPLKFDEFDKKIQQMICISATPAEYELKRADNVAEQIIRPTGLVDPPVEIRPAENQIDDLLSEILKTIEKGGRILVTTLTKKMAERLTDYLKEQNIKVNYMHSDIDTLDRIEIISSLRKGEVDVLVGINLLREGLDLPEVQLVAILDADKEGFLRSETSLIQTIGRAARNAESKVIMYADNITKSMENTIKETDRRRNIQISYNTEHNIIPKTIIKEFKNSLEITMKAEETDAENIPKELEKLKGFMAVAASNLDFEQAIILREKISELRKKLK